MFTARNSNRRAQAKKNTAAQIIFEDDFTSLSLLGGGSVGGSVNKMRNSAGQGAVVNASFPNYWSFDPNPNGTSSNLAASIASIGTDTIGGVTVRTITFRLQGTSSGQDCQFIFEPSGWIGASAGQNWTYSIYHKTSGNGSTAGVTGIVIALIGFTAAGSYVSGEFLGMTLGANLSRMSVSLNTATNTASVRPSIVVNTSAGAVIDYYFTVSAPQTQTGTTATTLEYTSTNDTVGVWDTNLPGGHQTPVNNEQQYYPDIVQHGTTYSDGVNPFSVSGSVLSITASVSPDRSAGPNNMPYISGVITTKQTFNTFTYGYFECRAKVPPGKGTFPAFWLLGSNEVSLYNRVEVDIMEHLGRYPGDIYGTLHWFNGTGNGTRVVNQTTKSSSTPEDGFHLYGAHVEPNKISFYYDRSQYSSILYGPGTNDPVHGQVDPTGQLQANKYIILNLAAGMANDDQWIGTMDETKMPAVMQVDYVRVWNARPF